jgi:hypothetical protein
MEVRHDGLSIAVLSPTKANIRIEPLDKEHQMKRRYALGICAIALAIPSFADAQALKDQLVGTWTYVSSTGKREDGSSVSRPGLLGMVTYTADGHFHFITTPTNLPKLASNDPTKPSPEEAMAIASRSVAYAGTYSVDENAKAVVLKIETSTFANLVGAPNQRRVITAISAEEMKFTNPRNPAGITLEFVWKRAK